MSDEVLPGEIKVITFDLADGREHFGGNDGFVHDNARAVPTWMADIKSVKCDGQTLQKWHRLLSSAKDRSTPVLVGHPARQWPLMYRAAEAFTGFGSFDGSGTVASYPDAFTIEVAGFPEGLVLSEGDHIQIADGIHLALHEIERDYTVGNGTINIEVTPRLRVAMFTTAAIVSVQNPQCLMKIIPGKSRDPERSGANSVSLKLREFVR